MNLVMHVWESTLCVGVAALLVRTLRHASARTRHSIWLLASVKFLVPFSLLVAAGSALGAWTSPMTSHGVSSAMRWLDRSLSFWSVSSVAPASGALVPAGIAGSARLALLLVWVSGIAGMAVWRWRQWRGVSRLARAATRIESGREIDALRRVAWTSRRARRLEVLQCGAGIEPGVLGIVRPRLLWPAGLSARLTDAELGAILAHEIRHVERGDNLSALLHVVVETVFWFHPIVWWLGARLVGERERACDEDVLRLGVDKRSYAEGILKVCRFCVRSPAAFVAGVAGSGLNGRLEWILTRPMVASSARSARLLVALTVSIAAGFPLAAGVVKAHRAINIEQSGRQVYRPGDGIVTPKLVTEFKPSYTPAAMQAKIQGAIFLEAVVLADGTVGEVKVVRSLDKKFGLDDEAVKTLKRWRFQPGKKDGTPVAVRVDIEMTFTLK